MEFITNITPGFRIKKTDRVINAWFYNIIHKYLIDIYMEI